MDGRKTRGSLPGIFDWPMENETQLDVDCISKELVIERILWHFLICVADSNSESSEFLLFRNMSEKIMAFGYGCICSDIKLKVYVV